MKETPIIMTHPKLILDGTMTMTRRVMKPQPSPEETLEVGLYHPTKVDKNGDQYPSDEVFGAFTPDGEYAWRCPYGQVGGKLWVRETWAYQEIEMGSYSDFRVIYKADNPNEMERENWKPSIHMFRKDSRINLEITEVRVERAQEITPLDCLKEGINLDTDMFPTINPEDKFRRRYQLLWDSLNAKRGFGWDTNCWLWAIKYKLLGD